METSACNEVVDPGVWNRTRREGRSASTLSGSSPLTVHCSAEISARTYRPRVSRRAHRTRSQHKRPPTSTNTVVSNAAPTGELGTRLLATAFAFQDGRRPSDPTTSACEGLPGHEASGPEDAPGELLPTSFEAMRRNS